MEKRKTKTCWGLGKGSFLVALIGFAASHEAGVKIEAHGEKHKPKKEANELIYVEVGKTQTLRCIARDNEANQRDEYLDPEISWFSKHGPIVSSERFHVNRYGDLDFFDLQPDDALDVSCVATFTTSSGEISKRRRRFRLRIFAFPRSGFSVSFFMNGRKCDEAVEHSRQEWFEQLIDEKICNVNGDSDPIPANPCSADDIAASCHLKDAQRRLYLNAFLFSPVPAIEVCGAGDDCAARVKERLKGAMLELLEMLVNRDAVCEEDGESVLCRNHDGFEIESQSIKEKWELRCRNGFSLEKHRPVSSVPRCLPCRAGHYGFDAKCYPCPRGTWQRHAGAKSCNVCPSTSRFLFRTGLKAEVECNSNFADFLENHVAEVAEKMGVSTRRLKVVGAVVFVLFFGVVSIPLLGICCLRGLCPAEIAGICGCAPSGVGGGDAAEGEVLEAVEEGDPQGRRPQESRDFTFNAKEGRRPQREQREQQPTKQRNRQHRYQSRHADANATASNANGNAIPSYWRPVFDFGNREEGSGVGVGGGVGGDLIDFDDPIGGGYPSLESTAFDPLATPIDSGAAKLDDSNDLYPRPRHRSRRHRRRSVSVISLDSPTTTSSDDDDDDENDDAILIKTKGRRKRRRRSGSRFRLKVPRSRSRSSLRPAPTTPVAPPVILVDAGSSRRRRRRSSSSSASSSRRRRRRRPRDETPVAAAAPGPPPPVAATPRPGCPVHDRRGAGGRFVR